MRVLVCVKRVPAPGARINVTADGLAVDATHLGFTTSPHEECALEEAVQIVEREGGEVTVLTAGPPEAEEAVRYAASVGAHHLALVPTDGSPWDPQRTARAIGAAVVTLEAATGAPFDLILFGNESADAGGYQVGVRVAHGLDRPILNGIKGLVVSASSLTARRETDAGVEVFELSLPALVGVKEGINLPRYATMKGRLASKKAVVDVVDTAGSASAGGQALVRLVRPDEAASHTELLGTSADAAVGVVDLLDELGPLPS